VQHTPKHCIFCGSDKRRSREHIWSRWLHKHIPGPRTQRHIRSGKSYQGDLTSVSLRVVCEKCNSGWMSAAEEAAKPILLPLIRGQPCVLSEKTQAVLARWIALKTMVLEYAQPNDVVCPQFDRTCVMSSNQAPKHWRIWIGRHASPIWLARYKAINVTLLAIPKNSRCDLVPPTVPPPKNTLSVALGVGYLFSVATLSTSGIEFEERDGITRRMFRLCPYKAGTLWPATRLLSTAEVNHVGEGFAKMIGRLPEWP
jgi:hypothetical protein